MHERMPLVKLTLERGHTGKYATMNIETIGPGRVVHEVFGEEKS